MRQSIVACIALCVSCSGNDSPKSWCKAATSAIESIEKRNAEYDALIKAGKPTEGAPKEALPPLSACELYVSAVAFAHGSSYGLHAGLVSVPDVNEFALTFLNSLLIDSRGCTAETAEKRMVELELLVSKERLGLERACK